MKNVTINRKTIVLILFTVSLIFGIQGTSQGFFDFIFDIIDVFFDVVGIFVDVIAGTVQIAADVVGLTVEITDTVFFTPGSITDVTFFPRLLRDGLISIITADRIGLWAPETMTETATFQYDALLTSVAFSPDGDRVVSGSADNTLQLWDSDTQTLQATLAGHTERVLSVAFNPDGALLASGSADNTLQLWDSDTQTLQATLAGHTGDVLSVVFSPDGDLLASASADGTLGLWDPQTQTLRATLDEHTEAVLSIAFSPDGTLLASGSADDTVRLWDPHTQTLQDTFNFEADVLSIAFSPDGSMLAIGSVDGTARLWDLDESKITATLGHESPVENVVFTPDGGTLVSSSADGKVRNWKIAIDPETDTTSESEKQQALTPATEKSTIVEIQPASVASPAMGEVLTLTLNIIEGKAVAGYEATVQFDTAALRYVSGANGDYLPAGAFFVEPKVAGNLVKLNAASLAGESDGSGTLATLTFEVIAVKTSALTLSHIFLSNSAGETTVPQVKNAQITAPTGSTVDVNGDGQVNIADLVLVASNLGKTGQDATDVNGDGQVNIADLVLVAGALGTAAAAPSLLHPDTLEMLTSADVRQWLSQAQHLSLTDAASRRGVVFLEQLLVVLIPKETTLLSNYPNPFNPETWIPYQLAKPAEVTLRIYAVNGQVVRRLALGHQAAGKYQSRSRAAYWDGRNAFGEPVASGLYFYTLTAGDFTATRKMLIRK